MNTAFTLKELSYLSGVSISTVSKALNNKSDVNIETKRKVQDLAKKYNYVPNNNAVSLRSKKTKTIGIILPQINLYPFSFFLYNFQLSAFQFGYRIVLFQTLNKTSQLNKYLNEINDGSVDAVIVLLNEQKNKNYLDRVNLYPIEYLEITEGQSQELLITKSSNCLIKLLSQLNKAS